MRDSVEPKTLTLIPRQQLVETVTLHTCLRNCFGQTGKAGSCCTIGTRDYIIGPIHDADNLLQRLSDLWGRHVPYEEVFIDYEEGHRLFPDKPCWQQKVCYPAIRPRPDKEATPCMFLGDDNLCTIHDIRSDTCRKYHCTHLEGILAAL